MHLADGTSLGDEPLDLFPGGSNPHIPNYIHEQPDPVGSGVVAEPVAIIGIGKTLG